MRKIVLITGLMIIAVSALFLAGNPSTEIETAAVSCPKITFGCGAAEPSEPKAGQPSEPAISSEPVRIVGSGRIATLDFDTTGLERLPDDMPAPPAPARKTTTLLHRPIAVSTKLIKVRDQMIELDGIVELDAANICLSQAGTQVPCVRLALTALRSWIRGRSIECELTRFIVCRLAGKDIGEWLVENGWALAAPESRYQPFEHSARSAKTGSHGISVH